MIVHDSRYLPAAEYLLFPGIVFEETRAVFAVNLKQVAYIEIGQSPQVLQTIRILADEGVIRSVVDSLAPAILSIDLE